MSAYTDHEEVEKLRAWWKNYGAALVTGVLLGLVLLFGNKYWQQYKEEQRVAASELYAQLLQQLQQPDTARASATKLMKEYSGTPYAGLSALMLARLDFEANDPAGARRHLEWAIASATDPSVVHVARLRLGRLQLAGGEHDAALALTRQSGPGFEAEYLELKGDVYASQGKSEDARLAYSEALKYVVPETSARRVLEMKLADLGGAPRQ